MAPKVLVNGRTATVELSKTWWGVICGGAGLLGVAVLGLLGWLLMTVSSSASTLASVKVQLTEQGKQIERVADRQERIAERLWRNSP